MDQVEPDIKHFEEFKDVLSINRPDYDAMKRIAKACNELKLILPDKNL